MFTQITLYDSQVEAVSKKTGLSKLEVLGVLAEINKFGMTPEYAAYRRERSDYHERMGHNV